MNVNTHDSRYHDCDFLTALLRQWRTKLGYFSIMAAVPAIIGSTAQDAAAAEDLIRPVSAPPVAGRMKKRARGLSKFFGKEEFLRRQAGSFAQRVTEKFESAAGLLTGSDNCPGTAVTPGKYTAAAPFSDTGDTTGANSTVSNLCYYYYCYNSVEGPDHFYSFTISSRGPSPRIIVAPTSASYNPAIYILDSRWGGCPTSNYINNWWAFTNVNGPGLAEEIYSNDLDRLPLNFPLHLVIDSADLSSGPYTLTFQDLGITAGPRGKLDFNGDVSNDLAVFRPSNRTWYSRSIRGAQADTHAQFGLATDKLVPGHYDSDGKTDPGTYRDGTWWWLASSTNTIRAAQFGAAGDIPIAADFTGDGQTDLTIYRGGEWWTYDMASGQYRFAQFGLTGDKPVAGDYDGDGYADIGVFRDGIWYLYGSRFGLTIVPFGIATDKLVPEDYDGDGRIDLAVYRNGTWYIAQSNNGLRILAFGQPGDIPAPGDFYAYGSAVPAVFRNGIWYFDNTSLTRQFGTTGDIPLQALE